MHTPSFEAIPGALIGGKYRLSKPLGFGGMAEVWLAMNETTGAEVALKMIHAEIGGAQAQRRLRREAQVAARLSHRGIVRVYDLVEVSADAGVAVVMEYLRGRTLAEHLQKRGKLSVDEALAVLLPVLAALAHAHEVGIVHRDLKPENIFLAAEPDGVVTPKLCDFGISKKRQPSVPPITRDGEVTGTPCYMSPEQLRADPATDQRSDVFTAGIVLYEILTGDNPFLRNGVQPTITAVLEDEPAKIDGVPDEVWSVLRRALEKSPEARFQSAAALAAALRGAVGVAERPSTPPLPPRAPSPMRAPHVLRRGLAALGIAAVALGLAVCTADVFRVASGAPARRVRSTRDAPRALVAPAEAIAPPAAPPPVQRARPKPSPRRPGLVRSPGF